MGVEKEGFKYGFSQSACEVCRGNCCIGESGYIWLTSNEAKEIARFLDISYEALMKKYIYKQSYRLSLREKAYDGGMACVFFDLLEQKCIIYPVRPSQCRSFPFWDYFKDKINEVERECPGIYRL